MVVLGKMVIKGLAVYVVLEKMDLKELVVYGCIGEDGS